VARNSRSSSVSGRVGEEVGAVAESFGEGLLATPAADGGVVSVGEDVGMGVPRKSAGGCSGGNRGCRSAVGGAGTPSGSSRLWDRRLRRSSRSGRSQRGRGRREAGGGCVEDDGSGELAAGEDVVADREFVVGEEVVDALVDALVAAADEDDAFESGEAVGGGLSEGLALGGEQDDRLAGEVACGFGSDGEGVDAVEDGSGFRTMPSPPPKGRSSTVRCGRG